MTSGVAVVPGPRDLLRLLLPRSRSPPHLPLCLHGRGHQTGGQGQPQAREVNIANGITVSGICQVVLIYAGLQNCFCLFLPMVVVFVKNITHNIARKRDVARRVGSLVNLISMRVNCILDDFFRNTPLDHMWRAEILAQILPNIAKHSQVQ